MGWNVRGTVEGGTKSDANLKHPGYFFLSSNARVSLSCIWTVLISYVLVPFITSNRRIHTINVHEEGIYHNLNGKKTLVKMGLNDTVYRIEDPLWLFSLHSCSRQNCLITNYCKGYA